MEAFFDCIPCAGLVVASGEVKGVNSQAAALFRRERKTMVGLPLQSLFRGEDAAAVERLRRTALLEGVTEPRQFRVVVAGEPREFETRMSSLTNKLGWVVVLFTDVSNRVRDERLLAHLALHDGLTGLPNRAHYLDRVGQALRRPDPFAIALLDLDGFKAVNDGAGHEAGDEVLQDVAERLGAALEPDAVVARLGGDEFGLLLPDVGTAEAACRVVANVHRALERPVLQGRYQVGASIGIALRHHGRSPGALLSVADGAMYRVKRLGKGRTLVGEAAPPVLLVSTRSVRAVPQTGLADIDDEHGELLHLVDRLVAALGRGEEELLLRWRLSCLEAALRNHFATEERLFHQLPYPRREAHEQEHADLLAHLIEPSLLASRLGITAAAHHVRDWLFTHTRLSDRHFTEWLAEACPQARSA